MATSFPQDTFLPETDWQDLPVEDQSRQLYEAMTSDETIPSTEAMSKLGDRLMAVTTSLAGNKSTRRMAKQAFFEGNTFQVTSKVDFKRVKAGDTSPRTLIDDPSLRPHICNLELFISTSDGLRSWCDQGDDAAVVRQLPYLYTKLRCLTVVVHNLVLNEHWCKPIETLAQERLEALVSVMQALKELPDPGERYLVLQQQEFALGSREESDFEQEGESGSEVREEVLKPIDIDGRGNGVKELCWTMLEFQNVKARV